MSEVWSNLQNDIAYQRKQNRRRIHFVPSVTDNIIQTNNSSSTNIIKQHNNGESVEHQNNNYKCKVPYADTSKDSIGLFDVNLVIKYINWNKLTRIGPGFFNDGNTCYLNSTLQCLMHTPSLVQVLQFESKKVMKNLEITSSTNNNPNNIRTILQHFQALVHEVWGVNSTSRTISPRAMISNIRRVGKQFKPLRQEDAHEYLRQLLDCMHEEILKSNGIKISDGKLAESTMISRIFGGDLCNILTCTKCNHQSKTFNHFQDLSLDINAGVKSILDAIELFTKPEYLSSGNEWKCEKCKMKVKAKKQMTIDKSPLVLVIHLKRFSYGNAFAKVTKPIKFSVDLNISCHNTKIKYDLYGVIVHFGSSTHSGHYIAYVKASNGQWYEMNDSRVTVVSINTVLACQAYILFYSQYIPAKNNNKQPNSESIKQVSSSEVNNNQTATDLSSSTSLLTKKIGGGGGGGGGDDDNTVLLNSTNSINTMLFPISSITTTIAATTTNVSNRNSLDSTDDPIVTASTSLLLHNPQQELSINNSNININDNKVQDCSATINSRLKSRSGHLILPFRYTSSINDKSSNRFSGIKYHWKWKIRGRISLRNLLLNQIENNKNSNNNKLISTTNLSCNIVNSNNKQKDINLNNTSHDVVDIVQSHKSSDCYNNNNNNNNSKINNNSSSNDNNANVIRHNIPSSPHSSSMEIIKTNNVLEHSKASTISSTDKLLHTKKVPSKDTLEPNPSLFKLNDMNNNMNMNNNNMMKTLISNSNRGHDIGGEGIWDHLSNEIINEISDINKKQRKEILFEKRLKKPNEWNSLLDQGRMKKMKLKNINDENNEIDNNKINSFQMVADHRLIENKYQNNNDNKDNNLNHLDKKNDNNQRKLMNNNNNDKVYNHKGGNKNFKKYGNKNKGKR